ncbi:MAG: response regulator transcription factor [Bacteroidales bacterium]|nr:response regulator transcription factor [Bacteroidales bacterium]
MNIVIIEDEELSAQRLEKMILETDPQIRVLAKLESIAAAVEWFRSNPDPDLIFLDIHLEDGLSFSIFEQVVIQSPIIFTTAYDEYAIKAFKLKSIDYLLKPITIDELSTAIQKYRNWTAPVDSRIDIRALYDLINPEKHYRSRFSVSIGDRIKTVQLTNIAYFYSTEGITFVVCHDAHEYTIDFSLDALEHDLDPQQFFRVNRQFLVGLSGIVQTHVFPKSRLKLELKPSPQQDVFVSIDRVVGFKRWLEG